MLNQKTIPSGADIPIQRFQKWFYDKLKTIWTLDDTNYDSYGKVYRNNSAKGYVPQWFVSSSLIDNTVYKDIFFDKDVHKLVSFFSAGTQRRYVKTGSFNTPVSMIFIGNASQIGFSAAWRNFNITWRSTEELRNDLYNLCEGNRYNLTLESSETGYKNVFKEFEGWLENDALTYMDIQPMFVIRLNFNLLYNIPVNFTL